MVAHTRSSPVEQSGEQITEIRADLTAEDGPGTVVGAAIEQQGHINALVNNAGIQPVAPFTDLADKDWAEMIGTNLTAVHRLTQAAASVMRDQGAGGSSFTSPPSRPAIPPRFTATTPPPKPPW